MEAPKGLVVHVQVGTGSLFEWFDNPASEVSAHYWIRRDGYLEQYVNQFSEAWAEMAGNPDYLSVETEGQPAEALTLEQATALAKLLAWCHDDWGLLLKLVDHGGAGITTHAHYPSGVPDPAWGGHSCPGVVRSAQLPRVLEAAVALSSFPLLAPI